MILQSCQHRSTAITISTSTATVLEGLLPKYPVDFASLERATAEVMLPWVHSYIAGGCGDERTQRANVEAFFRYAIAPRMLVGATERDLSVPLFDQSMVSQLSQACAQLAPSASEELLSSALTRYQA